MSRGLSPPALSEAVNDLRVKQSGIQVLQVDGEDQSTRLAKFTRNILIKKVEIFDVGALILLFSVKPISANPPTLPTVNPTHMAKNTFERGCGATLEQEKWVSLSWLGLRAKQPRRVDAESSLTCDKSSSLRDMLPVSLVGLRGCWSAAARQREGQTQQSMIRKGLLTRTRNTCRFTPSQKIVMVRSFFTVLLVQLNTIQAGRFLHSSDVLSLPNPDSSFSSSSSSSPSPTPTPTPTPTVHTIAMPSPFAETIFSMLYTQTNIRTVSPISTDRSAGPDYTMLPPDLEGSPFVTTSNSYTSTVTATGTLISNGDSWHFGTSDDSLVYFYKECELTGSNDIIQLSPSSSDEIGLSCDRRELGDRGWKVIQVLGDTLAIYTLTVTQDPQLILPRFSDVVKESGTTSENSIVEATRAGSNGSIRSFGDTGGNYVLALPSSHTTPATAPDILRSDKKNLALAYVFMDNTHEYSLLKPRKNETHQCIVEEPPFEEFYAVMNVKLAVIPLTVKVEVTTRNDIHIMLEKFPMTLEGVNTAEER
ncbi:hypothetical protein K435DRAFT_800100 [Dendrothele bispora CBS 962.96]|uniref:Uncharacterized protein n=1 Tax=Dendrothele bispora (strain CBS 962.96) TaxID=1314807 RepID=A0A4S8LV59_DENBC|nr:hypothetical protein K435DRAFT_800100 [Dendrothele bispora CBS 962.96]